MRDELSIAGRARPWRRNERPLGHIAGSEFLPKGSILLTELLKFGLQIFVGRGFSAAFVKVKHSNAEQAHPLDTNRKARQNSPVRGVAKRASRLGQFGFNRGVRLVGVRIASARREGLARVFFSPAVVFAKDRLSRLFFLHCHSGSPPRVREATLAGWEHTFKISLQICEGGLSFAAQTSFGPPPPRAPNLQRIPGARSPKNGRSADSSL